MVECAGQPTIARSGMKRSPSTRVRREAIATADRIQRVYLTVTLIFSIGSMPLIYRSHLSFVSQAGIMVQQWQTKLP